MHEAFLERQDRCGPDSPEAALGRIAFLALRLLDQLGSPADPFSVEQSRSGPLLAPIEGR